MRLNRTTPSVAAPRQIVHRVKEAAWRHVTPFGIVSLTLLGLSCQGPSPKKLPKSKAPPACPALRAPSSEAVFTVFREGNKTKKGPASPADLRTLPALARRLEQLSRSVKRDQSPVFEDAALAEIPPSVIRAVFPPDLCLRSIQEVAFHRGSDRVEVKLRFSAGESTVPVGSTLKVARGKRTPGKPVWDESLLVQPFATLFNKLRPAAAVKWLEDHPELLSVDTREVARIPIPDPEEEEEDEKNGDDEEADQEQGGASSDVGPYIRLDLLQVKTTARTTLCFIRSIVDDHRTRKEGARCFEAEAFDRLLHWGWQARLADVKAQKAPKRSKPGQGTKQAGPAVTPGRRVLAHGFIGLSVNGRVKVWALRFPAAERAPAGAQSIKGLKPAQDSPGWTLRPDPPPGSKLPNAGWIAMPSAPAPNLGPFSPRNLRTVRSRTRGLSAIAIYSEESDVPTRCCLRWENKWRCSQRDLGSYPGFVSSAYDSAYILPSSHGSPWAVLQKTTRTELRWDDIGGGQNDFALVGDAALVIHRLDDRRVVRVGSLKIGQKSYRGYHPSSSKFEMGSSAAYHHPHGAAGAGCLRIGKVQTTGSASNLAGRGARTHQDRSHLAIVGRVGQPRQERLPAPDRLRLDKDGDFVQSEPGSTVKDSPGQGAGSAGFSHKITIWPLTGLWRLGTDGMVRVSSAEACRQGKIPKP